MNSPIGYSDLSCYTSVPEPNSSYLSNIHYVSKPIPDGSAMGVLMILSIFQYQAPYLGQYSNAASQAGKAAYIQSGGQAMQDRAVSKAESIGKNDLHSIGVTDQEMGVFLGTASVIRSRQIDVNGPKILSTKIHLTISPSNATLGLKYEF